jgi:cysteine desulfurase
MRDNAKRLDACRNIRESALKALSPLKPKLTGDQSLVIDHVLNLAFQGLDSEALIVATKDLISISNGSACTSSSYSPSHVLKAMGMSDDEANSCIRISWCHMTLNIDWKSVADRVHNLL